MNTPAPSAEISVEDMRDVQEILKLLALSFAMIGSPSINILVARVTAVFAQHTAMAWAELLGDLIADQEAAQ